jgi:hypothetical protein
MEKLLEAIFRFNGISIKTAMKLFTKTEKTILKFIWKYQSPSVFKVTMTKLKRKAGGVLILVLNVMMHLIRLYH